MSTFENITISEQTGLTYAGARYYPARVGKWLSVDPLASEFPSWTPYHYVHNNPVNMTDPDGRAAWWPGVTTTYIEIRAAVGVGVGANFIRQSGVVRDEVGKTHFISQSQVMVDGSRPGSMAGGMASVMGGVSQDFKHETFLGQQRSNNSQFSAGSAAGPAVGLGFGDGTVSLLAGTGI
ncbi:RHS repeat-associated core domain-containing protein, partial [Arthrospira sp. PCC 8006]|uniref:RHS repeat protein n=1 Tax=Arthrospira sp. PCC 8006 TaxID=1982224 RepID=UPI00396F301D